MGRKLLAIGVLFLLLFNLFGYRLYLDYLQEQEAYSFQTQIHKNLNEQDLLTLKVPANLPYYFNSTDFEWVNGEVEVDGVLYQYVKRRIYQDSIEFQCLKNGGKMRLENAREEFFRLCNDLQATPANQKSSNTASLKLLLPEYCSLTEAYEFCAPLQEVTITRLWQDAVLFSIFSPAIEQPPEYRLPLFVARSADNHKV